MDKLTIKMNVGAIASVSKKLTMISQDLEHWIQNRGDYDEREFLTNTQDYINKLNQQFIDAINNLRTDLILKGIQYAYYPETRVEPQ